MCPVYVVRFFSRLQVLKIPDSGKKLFELGHPPVGENVENAFIETAKKIYQNIQDGSLDLNAAESGVQHKPSVPRNALSNDQQPSKDSCAC